MNLRKDHYRIPMSARVGVVGVVVGSRALSLLSARRTRGAGPPRGGGFLLGHFAFLHPSRRPRFPAGPAKPRPRGSVPTRVDRADRRSEGEGLFALYPRPARSGLLRVGGPLFSAGERARRSSPCEDWPGRRSEARCLARINESFQTARNVSSFSPGFLPVPFPKRSHADARWGPRRPAPNLTPTRNNCRRRIARLARR